MHISWIEPNVLAAGGVPLTASDMRSLHQQGIRAIVSLTRRSIFQFEITPMLVAHLDMPVYHMPLSDREPPTVAQVEAVLDRIDQLAAEGRPTLVHSREGMGRAGLILHAYYMARGYSIDAAMAVVKSRRSASALLTHSQRSVLKHLTLQPAC